MGGKNSYFPQLLLQMILRQQNRKEMMKNGEHWRRKADTTTSAWY